MSEVLTLVDCLELSPSKKAQLLRLGIHDTQREFGGSFEETFQDCLSHFSSTQKGLCILIDDRPIGILVLKRPPSSPNWMPGDAVSLHGLKIDERWQGQGLGRRALELGAAKAAKIWPNVRRLVLAVDAGNSTALALYRSFKMVDSGPVHVGRIGREHRMIKFLS